MTADDLYQKKRRRGRPSVDPALKRNVNLTFRARGSMRARLQSAAIENERSLSEEIELRLMRSFEEGTQLSAYVWRAMFSAPRDGTPIIVLWADYSTACILFYQKLRCEPDEPGDPITLRDCWWDLDGGDFPEDRGTFAGWMPLPEGTPLYEWERDRRLKEWGGLTHNEEKAHG